MTDLDNPEPSSIHISEHDTYIKSIEEDDHQNFAKQFLDIKVPSLH